MNDHIGEVLDSDADLPATMVDAADASLAVGLSRAEIDTQIATARRFPRDLKSVQNRLLSYVTLDEETAEECMYALPRGGKPIKGPSIRFAEALKASFGNCRAAARVVHVDRIEKVVIAEGIFHDLETNSATKAETRRRIVDKHGRIYKDDLIIVTGNAACSIALRNAVLGGVPKPVWRRAYDAVQKTITGNVATLSVTRDKAVKSLANFGVTPEQVYVALGVAGSDDITVDHIPIMRGMFAALKNGEATVEEMFAGTLPSKDGGGHQKIENPLSDEAPISAPTKPTEPEAQGSAPGVPEPQASAEASASADANGAADTLGTPAAPQPDSRRVVGVMEVRPDDKSTTYSLDEFAEIAVAETSSGGHPVGIAGETLDKPASGAEARDAGSVQGDGGSPSSANMFEEYSAFLSGAQAAIAPRDFKRIEQKFWLSREYPDDDALRAKFSRIYAIHLNLRTKQIDADQFTAQIREAVAS